ncbi:MAG: hypothetical protein GYB67_15455, partial [Chloroflexi bacterium]|nr:hypothetical protein [Chloroflexota bacterium]
DLATLLTLTIFALMFWFIPVLSEQSNARFEQLARPQQRGVTRAGFLVVLLVLLIAPIFMDLNITNILNSIGLFILLGIGLNIVVGYAGLLDLGYVAFYAIGAYAVGILTTPSLLTCGGIPPDEITLETVDQLCTGMLTFWEAWPLAVAITAFSGVLLGIPVLRLRGDYFAIVTLGFGEIIRLLVRFDDFKDLFGAAQGISNIPSPVLDLTFINPSWFFEFNNAYGIYYLVIGGVLLATLLSMRLANSRLGRAWFAMRADQDVAQAMGIGIVRIKLTAFAISAAFAGLGGAIAGVRLFGVSPDTFVLQVSINVLSLIIIGGLGSIPGAFVGAIVLVGMPEVLRELADYRLLAFGVLLVLTMLMRPQGLIPPPVRRLTEVAEERQEAERSRERARVEEGALP